MSDYKVAHQLFCPLVRPAVDMNTHIRSGVLQTLLCACALCLACVCVLSAGPTEVLLCYYCPLQAGGGRCANITTECAPLERCFTGWRRFGPVSVLAAQGCASPELCGSNQTHTLMGSEYRLRYTCCSRERCNDGRAPGDRLQLLLAVPLTRATP